MSIYHKKRGFTIIEVIVVVTIIGLLTSVVVANINNAKGKARDLKRHADLKAISTALTQYYLAHNKYPSWYDNGINYACSWDPGNGPSFRPGDGCLNLLVTEKFLPSLPTPPRGAGASGGSFTFDNYYYDNWCESGPVPNGVSAKKFRVWAISENPQPPNSTWWSNYIIGYSTCDDPT